MSCWAISFRRRDDIRVVSVLVVTFYLALTQLYSESIPAGSAMRHPSCSDELECIGKVDKPR